ncbi:hypothetical protein BKA60DRAFT_623439 [Fusarium oxysporum]|nr:hypothetical protein BKA60DRAFT_623439 [Fusarium oxysporum]
MARVGHKKSRHGCLRCKKRRVKCDEEVPCAACTRHKVLCSLQCDGGQGRDSPLASRRSTKRASASTKSPGNSSSPAFSLPTSLDLFSHPGPEQSDSWILDAELIHHYTMVSYGTLSHAPEVCHALRSGVFREALSHPYLLHELLAFAGFHLASLNPNDRHRYSLRAFHHQKMATGKMREAIAIMNSTNCHALFLTSIFLIVNAFAEPFNCNITGNTFSPTKAVVDIFSLVAGIKLIFHSSGLDLGSSPLNVLFIGAGSNKCDPYRLQSLLEQLPELRSRTYEAKGIEETQKQVLIASIEALQNCIDTVSRRKAPGILIEIRALFVWPVMLPKEFLELARDDHPMALVLLAYYSVILYWAEPECWFLNSWPKRLIGDIIQKLAGTPWASYIYWTVGCIHSN